MAAELPKGLVIGAVPPREDPRDVWISKTKIPFKQIPSGTKIGTGALSGASSAEKTSAQKDISLIPIRGNVDTRLRKLD